jgi:hypothetical protein
MFADERKTVVVMRRDHDTFGTSDSSNIQNRETLTAIAPYVRDAESYDQFKTIRDDSSLKGSELHKRSWQTFQIMVGCKMVKTRPGGNRVVGAVSE